MEITQKKLGAYKKYLGDIDAWARSGKKSDKDNFTDIEWHHINNLLSDIEVVQKGLGSKKFNQRVEEDLIKSCNNDLGTMNQLKLMAQNQEWRKSFSFLNIFRR